MRDEPRLQLDTVEDELSGLASEISVWWTDELVALRTYDEVRCELCCPVHSSMHNTTVASTSSPDDKRDSSYFGYAVRA